MRHKVIMDDADMSFVWSFIITLRVGWWHFALCCFAPLSYSESLAFLLFKSLAPLWWLLVFLFLVNHLSLSYFLELLSIPNIPALSFTVILPTKLMLSRLSKPNSLWVNRSSSLARFRPVHRQTHLFSLILRQETLSLSQNLLSKVQVPHQHATKETQLPLNVNDKIF